jgi:hypothetical protein
MKMDAKEPFLTATKTWVTGTKKPGDEPSTSRSKELSDHADTALLAKSCNVTNSGTSKPTIGSFTSSNIKNKNTNSSSAKIQKRKQLKAQISSGNPNRVNNDVTISNILRDNPPPTPGSSIQRFSAAASSDDEDDFRSFTDSLISEGKVITVQELQTVFDYFKSQELGLEECVRKEFLILYTYYEYRTE